MILDILKEKKEIFRNSLMRAHLSRCKNQRNCGGLDAFCPTSRPNQRDISWGKKRGQRNFNFLFLATTWYKLEENSLGRFFFIKKVCLRLSCFFNPKEIKKFRSFILNTSSNRIKVITLHLFLFLSRFKRVLFQNVRWIILENKS